ncbi:MAG: glycosyltransferase family 39 protein [Bacteroidota bacterium]|nr:glycosyltransferase family 39 protein [Bacteroidota bacterium]
MKLKFYLFLGITFIIINLGLGSWGLTESSEARYAEISREMVLSGDYVHPRLLEIQHFHKPPLTYYITSLGYQIFGINEFGARFFLQVCLLLQLILIYKIAELLFKNEKVAFYSAVIYLSFPLVLIATRNLTTDAYLVALILASIYSWLVYKKKEKLLALYACYFFMGLGFLNKGPVIILPVLVFTIPWKIIFKEKWRLTIHHVLGFALFVLVSASWFIVIIREMPELWNYFFQKHTVDRAISAEKFHRDQPFWYFFALAPAVGLPWFIYSLILLFKNYKKQTTGFNKEIQALMWSGGLLFLMFSAFSSKLILYILPVFPMVAMIGGFYLHQISEAFQKAFIRTYYILIALVLLALAVLPFFGVLQLSWISRLLVIALIGGFTVVLWRRSSGNRLLMGLTYVFTTMVLISFAMVGNQNPYLINTTKALVEKLKADGLDDAKNIVIYDQRLSSTAYYLDRPTVTVHYDRYNTNREVQFEQNERYQNYYLDINEEKDWNRFKRMLEEEDNVFILKGRTTLPGELQTLLESKQMDEAGKWKIYY